MIHFFYVGDVPVGERLVEGDGVVERVLHVGDVTGVPAGDRCVESGGVAEQPRHGGDAAGVERLPASRFVDVVGGESGESGVVELWGAGRVGLFRG